MVTDKWAKLERWLEGELTRTAARRDAESENGMYQRYVAFCYAEQAFMDVIKKMAEIEGAPVPRRTRRKGRHRE